MRLAAPLFVSIRLVRRVSHFHTRKNKLFVCLESFSTIYSPTLPMYFFATSYPVIGKDYTVGHFSIVICVKQILISGWLCECSVRIKQGLWRNKRSRDYDKALIHFW